MKTTFPEILDNNKVVIPILQRDYAQGRTDDKTTRIRKDFLDALFQVISDRGIDPAKTHSLELDFVYGFSQKENELGSFSPIDGQQRLTTMWLLWWLVAAKEQVQSKTFLSHFRYETRHSTTVFCEKLLSFQPDFVSDSISEEIKNQPWYFETWDYDPGIRAMLVMLDDIEKRYEQLPVKPIWQILNHPHSPFYFYKLDMEKVGLPDDLYIKMNSRGKPLTDFEYFKANFSEVIKDEGLKERFHNSIDQEWSETIWKIVCNSKLRNSNTDLAFVVDSCFMRFISFITDVLAFKEGVTITDVLSTSDELKKVYETKKNLLFLFDTLDCIVALETRNSDFWNRLFYIDKEDFSKVKCRLFFQNPNINLLEKCLFSYTKNSREFPLPEQLLLYACITQWLNKTADFERAARIVRNLVANSSNELRLESIGENFKEVERFVLTRDFGSLIHFKTDQIKEEKEKQEIINGKQSFEEHIYELEDSDLFRGCISIFDIDGHFIERKDCFLQIFEERIVETEFKNRANLLLCFGDYTQDDGDYTNILAAQRSNWRTYLTTPGFNKMQLTSKTKLKLMECLDYFITNPNKTVVDKINETLDHYKTTEKDWMYYFIKYPGFRDQCNKGYYVWEGEEHYPSFKMNQKYFNGYHWDPFLLEAKKIIDSDSLQFPNGSEMQLIVGDEIYVITTASDGFRIKNITDSAGDDDGNVKDIKVKQSPKGLDLEDIIEVLVAEINAMMHKSS